MLSKRKQADIVAKYYKRYADTEELKTKTCMDFYTRGSRVHYCHRMYDVDWYVIQKIKDVKGTSSCGDKFCPYCKKGKQAVRMAKFIPILEKYNNLYHMVLTVPNVSGGELKDTIKRMFKAFKVFINMLSGHDIVVGIDLESWGYKGALRSLEITYKPWGDYHPHLHVVIKLDSLPNNYTDTMKIINTYSVRHGIVNKLFSPQEVILQKLWRLLYDGVRVSKTTIDILDIGYSCIMEPIQNNDYYEIFKYLTKGNGKDDGESENYYLSYTNFKDLWYALFRTRQIQGYGCFYNLKIDEEEEEKLLNEVDVRYDEFIAELQKIEKPVNARDTLQGLKDSKDAVISRRKILNYLRQLYSMDDD